jgi:aspartyl-tRNA(Asn)/glutamyl-tRNA(Gln) amidotransferase subunit C
MKIRREEVLHIAELAEIGVDDADLPSLVAQLDRIVEYVAQLEQAPAEGDLLSFQPGPAQVAWRADEVRPEPLAIPPAQMAPAWRGGYFVVPRLTGMEDA